jgi:deazaflavin-dependent oxidoreductase (nitroreductase family)
MAQSPTIPPLLNDFMRFVLRSPLHGMVSKSVLLITFTGRKSGKRFTTPVSYSLDGERVMIFSHAEWWKNLTGGSPVTLRLRGRSVEGTAEVVADDKRAVAAGLVAHLSKVPSDARYYGVTFDEQGNPKAGDAEAAARDVVMIRVRLH